MKFWEAMKIVDEGGKVRRVSWVDCGFVQEVEDGDTYAVMWLVGMDGILYDPQQSDLRAIDWIEVDSESDGFVLEALPRTVVYELQEDDIDPNNISSFPWGTDISDWIDGFDDLIEETDYLEEDDE